ncbi:hypothetical protein cyc_02085 [Cyclospora cayetanensis]|uniref:Uncharacterized protein n=1 Tax=Cyclospora cayetanensis TaxID=88456 RepID=A0A1D3D9V1_9EIME|nr:hypothetical protein cyc_02085 [Cyclospora cayetanensis]
MAESEEATAIAPPTEEATAIAPPTEEATAIAPTTEEATAAPNGQAQEEGHEERKASGPKGPPSIPPDENTTGDQSSAIQAKQSLHTQASPKEPPQDISAEPKAPETSSAENAEATEAKIEKGSAPEAEATETQPAELPADGQPKAAEAAEAVSEAPQPDAEGQGDKLPPEEEAAPSQPQQQPGDDGERSCGSGMPSAEAMPPKLQAEESPVEQLPPQPPPPPESAQYAICTERALQTPPATADSAPPPVEEDASSVNIGLLGQIRAAMAELRAIDGLFEEQETALKGMKERRARLTDLCGRLKDLAKKASSALQPPTGEIQEAAKTAEKGPVKADDGEATKEGARPVKWHPSKRPSRPKLLPPKHRSPPPPKRVGP